MSVKVSAIPHRRIITEEVLGIPRHDVCLPRRHLVAADRATIGLFGTVCGNIPDEPLNTAAGLFSGSAVCEPSHITR